MSDEVGASGGLGAAAQEMLSTLQSMRSVMAQMVESSGKIASNFSRAGKSASGVGGGLSANAGDAGNLGYAQKAMDDKTMSHPTTHAGDGGHTSMSGGGWGSESGAIGLGGFGAVGALATGLAVDTARAGVNAALNVGRSGVTMGSNIEKARLRNQTGGSSDWDKVTESMASIGYDRNSYISAQDRFVQSGLAVRSGFGNLSQMISLGALQGLNAEESVAVLGSLGSSENIYAAQAAGFDLLKPGGGYQTQSEIMAQIMQRMAPGMAGKTQEEIADQIQYEFSELGYGRKVLSEFMTPEQIEMYKQGLLMANQQGMSAEQVAGMSPEEFKEMTEAGRTDAERAKEGAERAQLGRDIETSETTEAAYVAAAGKVEEFNQAIADLIDEGGFWGKLVLALESFTGMMETLVSYGVPNPLAAGLSVSGLGGPYSAEGDEYVSNDSLVNVHQGEMIIPRRIANAVRSELGVGAKTTATRSELPFGSSLPAKSGGTAANVNITVNVQQASEAEARRLAVLVKNYLSGSSELSGVGMGQVIM